MHALFADDIRKQRAQQAEAAEDQTQATPALLVPLGPMGCPSPVEVATSGQHVAPSAELAPSVSERIPPEVLERPRQAVASRESTPPPPNTPGGLPTLDVEPRAQTVVRVLAGALALSLGVSAVVGWPTTALISSAVRDVRSQAGHAPARDEPPVATRPDAERIARHEQPREPLRLRPERIEQRDVRAGERRPERERLRLRPARSEQRDVRTGERHATRASTRSEAQTRKREQTERSASAPQRSDRGAQAKAGPGALTVTTPGCWAAVYADGQQIGMSPGRFSLPAGSHEIALVMQGQGPRLFRRIEVRPGATAVIRVDCT